MPWRVTAYAILRAAWLPWLLPLVLIGGCRTDPAVSLTSVFETRISESTFDARLLGQWHTPTDPGDRWPPAVLEVRAATDMGRLGYEIVAPWYFTGPVRADLFEHGDARILEMRLPTARSRESVAPFHYAAVQIDGDRLRVSLLSMHLGGRLRRGGGDVPAMYVPGLFVLTGDPVEALQAAAARVHPEWMITLER